MTGDLLTHALAYSDRGWTVIPIKHRAGTSGKQPAIREWKTYQRRRPTDSELRAWFGAGRKPDGLAVVLGDASDGLVCRDFDRLDAYERWRTEYPEYAKTLPTVETSRGRHVYFGSDWRGFIDFGDGELRGDSGHYCLLPPSVHPDGSLYRWVNPLPTGPLPNLDPAQTGLWPCETERQRDGDTEETEKLSSKEGSSPQTLSASGLGSFEAEIEAAIAKTLPTHPGRRNRAVFEFARELKAIPGLCDAKLGDLRDIVRQWHVQALPHIDTKAFDDTWADFVTGWPSVRFPAGEGPMSLIQQAIEAGAFPEVAMRYDAIETRQLIVACRELQRLCGETPFFLSCRTAAELTLLDLASAWRRLRMLETDGVLVVVKRGNKHRATRYRYVPVD